MQTIVFEYNGQIPEVLNIYIENDTTFNLWNYSEALESTLEIF